MTLNFGRLWNKDHDKLKEAGFLLECLNEDGQQTQDTHQECYKIFKNLPLEMVTAFQGYCEWHVAQKFSITSTTLHA